MARSCCGQPARRRVSRPAPAKLPANPPVRGGVRLLYLGAEAVALRGASGLLYHAGPARRFFVAAAADAELLLRRRDVILAPLTD